MTTPKPETAPPAPPRLSMDSHPPAKATDPERCRVCGREPAEVRIVRHKSRGLVAAEAPYAGQCLGDVDHWRLGYERLLSERDRARAEAFEKAARVASDFSMKPDRSLHPDVPWDNMNEAAKASAHSAAQSIAMDIRALASAPREAQPDKACER